MAKLFPNLNKKTKFKVFKENEVLEIAKGFPNGLYEDPYFPASNASLFKDPNRPSHSYQIAWKRPKEIDEKAVMFLDGIEPGDVIQGALGDCWILGSLAAVAQRDLLYPLVVSTHPEAGFYQIRFWKHGAWVVVTVDDRIPCNASTGLPIYARCKETHEMWLPIFEKAYAKLHGSYQAIEGGVINYGLMDLTAGVSSDVDLPKMVQDGSLEEYLRFCLVEEEWLMGAAHVSGAIESDLGNGILAGHAYSLLGIKATPDGRRKLVRVRNPWGRKEWTGEWSDNDAGKWTEEMKRHFDYAPGDDGTFWMSLEDFGKVFNRIYECRLYEDEVGIPWNRTVLEGEWKNGSTAGGCRNHPTWTQNPQFGFVSKTKGKCFLTLHQRDSRMLGTKEDTVGLTVLNGFDPPKRIKNLYVGTIYKELPFTNKREIACEIDVEAGKHYVVFASTFDPNHEGLFMVTVYSTSEMDLYSINPDDTTSVEDADPLDMTIYGSGVSEDDFRSRADSKFGKKMVEKMSSITTMLDDWDDDDDDDNDDTPPPKQTPSAAPKQYKPPTQSSSSAHSSTPQSNPFARNSSGSNTFVPTIGNTRPSRSTPSAAPSNSRPFYVNRNRSAAPKTHTPSHTSSHTPSRAPSHQPQSYASSSSHGGSASGPRELKFSNGDRWVGNVVSNMPQGKGTYYYANGRKLIGSFTRGKCEGKGNLYYPNGKVLYTGDYRGGVRTGKGTFFNANGDCYQGEFLNGKFHGSGCYLFKTGARYIGEMFNGKFNGHGMYTTPGGKRYVGNFTNGIMNGKGTMQGKDWLYSGQFQQSKMTGMGVYLKPDGTVLTGRFVNGTFQG